MVDPNPSHPGRRLRIALAHDWLVGMRGGERVLDAIARALATEHEITALYTMFDDGRGLSEDLDRIPKRVAWLGRLPGATRLRRWLLPLYPAAVGASSRRLARDHATAPIDLVISTSSAAIKGLRAPRGVPHLCYCHTPARYLWSQAEEYAGGLRGLGLAVFGGALRRWDRWTARNATEFLANSTHTAAEIARCYGRAATVLFPPVRTEFFTPDDAGVRPSNTWLAVGALEAYKRFDLAIEAAKLAGAELVIVGGGSDERRLRELGGADRGGGAGRASVRFLGRVDDDRLRELYRTCRLLVFPQVEDFGIVAVEAQACGCPVLARRAGGALDTVVDGVTGALFEGATPAGTPRATPETTDAAPERTVDAMLAAAARVPQRTPTTTQACRANAERFAEAAFAQGLREALSRALIRSATDADHHPP